MASPSFRFKVGHFNCLVVPDRDANDHVSERNVLLIHTSQQRVLIEPGLGGNLIPGSSYPGLLSERLAEAGISPTAIDLVLFTHADIDHIGGGVNEDGNATFPHARYLLSRAEWAFWSANPERLHPSDAYDEALRHFANTLPPLRLAQLRDKLDLIEAETEVAPGIRTIAAPGHTPGHTVFTVSSSHDHLLFIGDLIYEPKDVEDPAWYSVFDFDPEQAVATRQKIFAHAAREQTLLMAYHLPFPGLGYVVSTENGWRWKGLEPAK